jgi:hypothetical protein
MLSGRSLPTHAAMRPALLLSLLLFASTADAVVIRHDVDDARYRVSDTELPALVDLPHEGHGVLIAPQWIVTAAHATRWHPIEEVMLAGECRKVERLVVHPGYRPLPKELQTGDAAKTIAWLAGSDDIALIKLAEPASGAAPVALYREADELGRQVMFYGKGATGNGLDGQAPQGPNRTALRRAYNTIIGAHGRWFGYRFDADAAEPLEGMLGNGDSGGPVLIRVGDEWRLAGLASWKHVEGELGQFRAGLYGQTAYQVRISHDARWIEDVLAGEHSQPAPAQGDGP